ncbi:MAG: protein phosphatase 2C domain-containing protein [Pseudomonadota bacterium]|nr:protein phosphatase 2C domain-containing protein [Pseudomonadota bacterium]
MVHVVSISQKGSKSTVNEDACLALPAKGIFVVADGVGGGPAGDFASRTLVNEIEGRCASGENPEQDLLAAIQSANQKIFQAGQQPRLNGMATTVAALVLGAGSILVCHVGDSRVYRLAAGRLTALTRDHSKLLDRGGESKKSVVTNALGLRDTVKIELNRFDLEPEDRLYLMTDGISDVVEEQRMAELLGHQGSTSEGLMALVAESEALGGKDDKTILCVF